MLTYDPVSTLQHYPMSMSRFGLNPYGECMYRIVFAPSRRYLVVGEWPDGSDCARWVVKHKNVGNQWIMERWRSPERYAQCSRQEWDSNPSMLTLGPWPDRGEYELCHVFDVAPPADANVETLVRWIEYGITSITPAETLQHHQKLAEAEKADNRSKADAMIRSRLPAYGCRPFAGAGGSRGTKTAKILKSAEELGLPTKPGLTTRVA